LDLEAVEVGYAVDDNPGKRASEVEEFVNSEGHDARRQDVVAHPRVPGHPHLLEVVELDIVLGDLLKGAPVRVLRHWRQDGGCVVPGMGKHLMGVRTAPATYILQGRDAQ
jgi:hypothetical protein